MELTHIYCPQYDSFGLCNISLLKSNSISIYGFQGPVSAAYRSNLRLNMSCEFCNVFADYSNNIDLTTTYLYSANIEANYVTDWVNMSCNNMFYATNTAPNCITYSSVRAEHANRVYGAFVGENAISESRIYAYNASAMHILCASMDPNRFLIFDEHSACKLTLYAPDRGRATIECEGNGCGSLKTSESA